MQKTRFKKSLSFALSIMLTAAIAMFTSGCNGSTSDADVTSTQTTTEAAVTQSETAAETEAESETETAAETEEETQSSAESADTSEVTVVGEGETTFSFIVTDKDGNETAFEVHTDKATVGEALLDVGLIAGDESEYGLYVKTVNGITADYDTDGVYWAFYINGEYASTGVDSTDVAEGAVYSFKVE